MSMHSRDKMFRQVTTKLPSFTDKKEVKGTRLYWHKKNHKIHFDLRIPKRILYHCYDLKFKGNWHVKKEQKSGTYVDICLEFSGEKELV